MAEPLKNQYDRRYLERLASVVADCMTQGLDVDAFIAAVLAEGWPALELKARMGRISETLRAFLPPDFRDALPIVRRAAARFDGYLAMYFPDFVERYGLAHWDVSIEALHWLTRFSSSEFAVRPFLKANAARMLATMQAWTQDENEHVRRLASEGCRPRLPWAMNLPAFQADPAPLLPILEALRDDESEYVRRSVANNLNDISKDHPALVLGIATSWRGRSTERDRLVKHACRTLLKSGDTGAMRIFGFQDPADIEVTGLRLERSVVPWGEAVAFSFTLRRSGGLGKLRLEYVLEFARPSGRPTRKVFKISEFSGRASLREVTRKHSLRDRNTRKHHPGEHRITLVINGRPKGELAFGLAGR